VEIEECAKTEELEENDYSYIVFPKTDWGKKVVAEVDDILRDFVKTDEFRSYYEFWLDNAGERLYQKRIRKLYGLE